MKINPKYGIDQLLFGMKQSDVIAIYGQPDKKFNDEEGNIVFTYNTHRWRLTFYQDEDFRFGYAICSNPDLLLLDKKVIGREIWELKNELGQKKIGSWEREDFDLAENHFNEENWLVLQSEFNEVTKVELGAIINDKDEFDWKFKIK